MGLFPVNCNCIVKLFAVVIIITTLLNIKFAHASCHAYQYTPDDCGLIEEIPGDTRTQIPWTAGIFLKTANINNTTPNNDSEFIFHATGTIFGPTTILTVFTGPLEKLVRKIRGTNKGIAPPNNFIVGAGLHSGNLRGHDGHAQFAEVAFIEPHLNHDSPTRDFHFVLFHLKTTLDFSTPYVKSICLPHFQQQGRKINNHNDNKSVYLHGGFFKSKPPKNKTDRNHHKVEIGLQLQAVYTGMGYECVKTYEKYYPGVFPVGMFCAMLPPLNNHADDDNDLSSSSHIPTTTPCLTQGSAITHKIRHQYYLSGITTFIRGRKGGLCRRNDTVYFNSRLSLATGWVDKALRCSPYSHSCSDGTCIPLDSLCNSIRNCLDTGSDEDDILCEINRNCGSGGGNLHQCRLGGGCISKTQICDGFRDCDHGSDESPVLCNRELSPGSRSSRDISESFVHQHCPPLHESDGVQIEYVSLNRNALANCTYIPEGTFAISKCKPFYKATQTQSRLEQQCAENGKWSDQIKFRCQPDCGILNEKTTLFSSLENDTDPKITVPWHILLFNLDTSTQKIKFVCGASVISSKYLITGGHCFEADSSLKSFKVVGAPVGKNFTTNLHHERPFITEIDNAWRPDGFDRKSRKDDIALVKVKRPFPFGALIRPACFLDDDDNDDDNVRDNKISPLSKDLSSPSFARTGLHIHDFPFLAEMACVTNSFGSSSGSAGFQCVGHDKGNSVRQFDTGGGLVSLTKTKFGSRYALKGVMSYEEIQDAEPISHFIPVEKYRLWISEIIRR